MNNNNKQQKAKRESMIIGSYWNKSNDKGEYQSISLTGAREQDEFEVILRRKSDQAEMPLSGEVSIFANPAKEKSKEKSPDGYLKVYFNE